MNYVPAPIDTAHVDLSEDLLELCRLLAKNNHEVWARQRLDDGWQYGPARDDGRKEHPSLVPYEELSESERKYDVIMAAQLLKAVMVMGFHIQKS